MTTQSIEGAMPPLPEPAFRLLWKHGDYHVTKANIDDTDVFTLVEMHTYAKAYAAPLLARVAELEAALKRIYFFQQVLGSPPLTSVAEQMRAIADAALAAHKEQP